MKRDKDSMADIAQRLETRKEAKPKTDLDIPSNPADDTYKDEGHVDPKRARQDKA